MMFSKAKQFATFTVIVVLLHSISAANTISPFNPLPGNQVKMVDGIEYIDGMFQLKAGMSSIRAVSMCGTPASKHKLFSIYRHLYANAPNALLNEMKTHFPVLLHSKIVENIQCYLISPECIKLSAIPHKMDPNDANNALVQTVNVVRYMRRNSLYLSDALHGLCYHSGRVVFPYNSSILSPKLRELLFMSEDDKAKQIDIINTAIKAALVNLLKQARPELTKDAALAHVESPNGYRELLFDKNGDMYPMPPPSVAVGAIEPSAKQRSPVMQPAIQSNQASKVFKKDDPDPAPPRFPNQFA
ncbi:hypothetical protein BDF22DRAFT_184748 [Syncephalis plumigaleata]|nr:hypothetical protein BDF22DRAFT_184748 [Syncephalis plumigaleata]